VSVEVGTLHSIVIVININNTNNDMIPSFSAWWLLLVLVLVCQTGRSL